MVEYGVDPATAGQNLIRLVAKLVEKRVLEIDQG